MLNKILVLFLGCMVCGSLGFCLASPAGGQFAMSNSEMANLIGGQCVDCNDCNRITPDPVFYECYHTRTPADCNQDPNRCIKNVISTASCTPNQGDAATGCDTDTMYPHAPMVVQHVYSQAGYVCPFRRTDIHLWMTVYAGCDTDEAHYCDPIPWGVTCDTDPCPGNWIFSRKRSAGVRDARA